MPGCCPIRCLIWKELAMVMAVALVFAVNIEYCWEIAVMCTKVLGGAWAGGRGSLQGEREGPAG